MTEIEIRQIKLLCIGKKLEETNPQAFFELVRATTNSGMELKNVNDILISTEMYGEFRCPSGLHNYHIEIISRCDSKIDKGCPICFTKGKSMQLYETRLEPTSHYRLIHQSLFHCINCGLYNWQKNKENSLYNNDCTCVKQLIVPNNHYRFSSFTEEYPELSEEYSKTTNVIPANEISMEKSIDNGIPVNWKCKKCGETFSETFQQRIMEGERSCPYCNKIYARYEESLAFNYPEIALRYSKYNELTATKVFPLGEGNSTYTDGFFQCEKCGLISKSKIKDIVEGKECDFCKIGLTKERAERILNELIFYPGEKLVDPHNKSIRKYRCQNCWQEFTSTNFKRFCNNEDCPCEKEFLSKNINRFTLNITHKDLLKEWSINNDALPNKYIKNSACIALWICSTCHGEYEAAIKYREISDHMCPYCNGSKALAGYNTLLETDLELSKEWSANNLLAPEKYTKSSKDIVIWVCPTCHGKYKASISVRELNDNICPYCNEYEPLYGYNSLIDSHKELCAEWSKNNLLGPESYLKSSHDEVLWICSICHGEYKAPISYREYNDTYCPICKGLEVLSGYNSLIDTDRYLAEQWSPNNILSPNKYMKTSNTEVLWICPTCHGEYEATINYRIFNNDTCPYCKGKKVLYGYNTFKILHHNLLNEWDYINNYLLCNPDYILECHSEMIWWICKECGNKYQLSPRAKVYYDKRHMKSCQHCKGIRRKKIHFF